MKHRKLTSVVPALLMAASLCACSGASNADPVSSAAESSSASESSAAEESRAENSRDESESRSDESRQSQESGNSGTESSASGSAGGQSSSDDSSRTESSRNETSKAESSKAETSKAESSKTESSRTEQIITDSADLAAAQKYVERTLNGIVNRDRQALLDNTNIRDLVGFYRLIAESLADIGEESTAEVTDEEILEELFSEINNDDDTSVKSWRILRKAENRKLCKEYNDEIDEIFDQLDEELEEGEATREQVEQMKKIYRKVSRVYIFEIEATEKSGDSNVDYVFVTQRGDQMGVDLTFSSFSDSYLRKARTTRANSIAKSVSNACNAALTDVDERVGIGAELNGTYSYKGSDFKNLQPVTLNEDSPKGTKLAAVKYSILSYYDDISELDEIGIVIKDGTCSAVAVRSGETEDLITGESSPLFGTYPKMISDSDQRSVNSLDQAIQFAQKKN